MPHPSVPRPGATSLEHRLPLLITALLAATMAIAVLFAYSEVKRSARDSARSRLALVSQQLAGLVAPSVPRRLDLLRGVGAHPAVLAFLAAPAPERAEAAVAALEGLRTTPQPGHSIVLLGRDLGLRLAAGAPLAAADSVVAAALRGGLLPPGGGVGPLFQDGEAARYWSWAPALRGADTVGHVAELRVVGSANTAEQIEGLIGRGVEVVFANSDGSGPWVALDGAVEPAPPAWPFAGGARYAVEPGGERFAHATAVPRTPWSAVVQLPVATVLTRPQVFLRRSVVAALLLGLLGAAGAWLLSRSITAPLRSLRLAAEAVARGDYRRRIQLRRADELGILSDAFDRMAEQVQSTHQELRQQYETARALAQELDRASRAKSDFLATMSHEIRTPINAIIGYTDLLQMGLAGPVNDRQTAQLERIRISGRHLIGLVDQVLDLARIEAGTVTVESRPADAAASVETALTVLRPQADEKGVELAPACGSSARYLGDPHRVEQILVNLLSNAIKFTDAGGRVDVRCTVREGRPPGGRAGRWACLTVEDTGVGIPEEQLESIFEPFVQVESGYTRTHGGAGLGLAISRHLARAMGGELTVTSEPGAGSSFTLWLAAAADAEPARSTRAGAAAREG